MNKVLVYLGCRKGSQRVKNKNSRVFCGFTNKSLFEIKMEQLLFTKSVKGIFFSTDDRELIRKCENLYQKYINDGTIIIHEREEYFASSECSGKEYQEYVYKLLGNKNEHILWTHTTSPFLTAKKYEKIIDSYFNNLGRYDSLMTVKTLQNYILNQKGELVNSNGLQEKWPATQNLETLYEVDSGAFIIHSSLMKKYNNRVGKRIFLYENKGIDGMDIDYEEEFKISKMIWEKLNNLYQ